MLQASRAKHETRVANAVNSVKAHCYQRIIADFGASAETESAEAYAPALYITSSNDEK
jgi:hypothetical protein